MAEYHDKAIDKLEKSIAAKKRELSEAERKLQMYKEWYARMKKTLDDTCQCYSIDAYEDIIRDALNDAYSDWRG